MAKTNRINLVPLTISAIIAIALAMFIHDSGSTVLGILRIGGQALFLPLFFALIVFYVLESAVSRLERKGMPRHLGVLTIYAVLIAVLGSGFYFFGSLAVVATC